MWYGVVESSSLYCVVRVRIKKRIASVFKKSQSISIGTCCLELYVFTFLKLPAPPRAALCYIMMIIIQHM